VGSIQRDIRAIKRDTRANFSVSVHITKTSIMSEDTEMESFSFTKAGIIIPMVTGSISFLSSMIIIFTVLRSISGTKTTYHRIILFMSSADCLTSLAIALTTIPMPKDVIYPFQMPSYGNIATCEAQGLIFMMGTAFGICMNGILNIYYLCTMRYNMTEKTFRWYLEIPLFIVSLAISITLPSTAMLKQKLLNPSPSYPFCVPNVYPLGCTKADNPECRGGGENGALAPLFYCTITLGFFTLMITMALIVHSFYRNARSVRKALKDKPSQEIDAKYEALQYAQESSGIITRQAIMYIAAFLITWVFGFVHFVLREDNKELLSVLRMIFQPLQGFFNLNIFTYHKVCMVRRSDEDLTVGEAFGIVFLYPDEMEDPAQVHNLDFVFEDNYGIGKYAPQNSAVEIGMEIDGSEEDLSGLQEDGNLEDEAGHGIHLDLGKASMAAGASTDVSVEGMTSMGEERSNKYSYKYYGNQKGAAQLGLRRSGGKLSPLANEVHSLDGDLSLFSKETNDDGISFTSKTIKKPRQTTKEGFDDDDVTNLS